MLRRDSQKQEPYENDCSETDAAVADLRGVIGQRRRSKRQERGRDERRYSATCAAGRRGRAYAGELGQGRGASIRGIRGGNAGNDICPQVHHGRETSERREWIVSFGAYVDILLRGGVHAQAVRVGIWDSRVRIGIMGCIQPSRIGGTYT